MFRFRLLSALLFLFCLQSTADASNETAERLTRAKLLNGIDDASLHPWHLKLSFEIAVAEGKAPEKGTIEEWWKSPSVHRVVFNSPSFSGTEIQTEQGLYRSDVTSSAPYLLNTVLQEIVHPLAEEDLSDGTPDLRKKNYDKVPLDCIMISQPVKDAAYSLPLGLFPTYCFDRNEDILRASYNFGSQTILRNNIGVFQKRSVPLNIVVLQMDRVAITAHVEDLRTSEMSDNLFSTAQLQKIDENTPNVPSGVMAGNAISQPRPQYPESAKRRHASGAVIFHARIGTDGKIHSLKFVSMPDPDLAVAALAAVRQWTYRPYLLNGVAVQVLTTITVNFNMY